MASTRDYLDYLNNHIDIAPANSQEELDAAHLVQNLMEEHGLDTTLEEFDASGSGEVPHDVLYIILLVGMVLSGILGSGVAVVGRLLVLASVVLLALRFGGYDFLGSLGSKARSQNVIGVHRATGPLVVKGNRPIVVVAHYDTPNESFLYGKKSGGFLPFVRRFSLILVTAVSLCMILQIVPLPNVARHVFWIIGILAALPLLVVAVADIYERFAPCTSGANDNKSSLAALLGLMDMVRPGDDDAKRWAADHPLEEPLPQEGTEPDSNPEQDYADMDEAAIAADQSLDQVPVDQTQVAPAPEDAPAREDETEPDQGGFLGKVKGGAEGLFGRFRSGGGRNQESQDELLPEPGPAPMVEPTTEAPSVIPVAREEESLPQPEPQYYEGHEPASDEPVSAEETPYPNQEPSAPVVPADMPGQPRNVRRGLEFIESLQILPSDCEIVYERPPRPEVDLSNLPEVPEMPSFKVEDFYNRDEFKAQVERGLEEQESAEEDELHSGYIPSFIERRAAEKAAREAARVQFNDNLDTTNAFQALDAEAGKEAPDRYVPQVDDAYRTAEEAEAPQAPEADGDDYLDEDDYLEEPQADGFMSKFKRAFASLKERFSKPDSVSGNTEQFDALDDDDLEDYELQGYQAAPVQPADEAEPIAQAESVTDSASAPAPFAEASTDQALPRFDDADTTGSLIEGDLSGLDQVEDYTGPDQAASPAPVDDPKWGVSEYAPAPARNVANRAVLFDLPDPSSMPKDPLAPDDQDADMSVAPLPYDGQALKDTPRGAQEPLGFVTAENGFEYEGDDHADHKRKGSWKGGATDRYDLRPEGEPQEGEDLAIDQEVRQDDLREAILGMGDDELVAHDIWFVALGASGLRHAGMRDFLAGHRKDIRGSFVINLDSVGAGDLAVLTAEGSTDTRHSDRRLIKLISTTAAALHIRMDKRRYDWNETDATPAMAQSLRSITIMGLDEKGMPELSHTSDDVPENLNPSQVVSVAQLVAEVIRRS